MLLGKLPNMIETKSRRRADLFDFVEALYQPASKTMISGFATTYTCDAVGMRALLLVSSVSFGAASISPL